MLDVSKSLQWVGLRGHSVGYTATLAEEGEPLTSVRNKLILHCEDEIIMIGSFDWYSTSFILAIIY